MFTNVALSTSNWLQHKDHGSSIYTRPVLDSFSFGSRWVLVRSSFVSRSSLVAYSLVYRRPIENRTRIERISNERRTKEDRENDGKPSKTWRKTVQFDGSGPLCFSSFSLSQMSRMKARFNSAMARKRRMKSTVFVKPVGQNKARFNFAMARKRRMQSTVFG